MTSLQMRPDDWLRVVRTEYLGDFVLRGGATVKFAVPAGDQERSALQFGLEAAAAEAGYQFAGVDAAATKIHISARGCPGGGVGR